jgi:dienelactone hydrolase
MDMEPISYEAGGRPYPGFLADGSGGSPAPGVLVFHEAAGLTDQVKGRAAMLAELGFVAFAPSLFEADLQLPVPGKPETMAPAQAVVKRLREDVPLFKARLAAALGVLLDHPYVDKERLAAIGYCLGGAAAIELARSGAPLKAIAGFHAGVLPGTEAEDRAIRARILLCHGAEDPVVPPAQIRHFTTGLSRADLDWQLHLYDGVGHSFTNPEIDAYGLPGFFYHAEADRRSWAALLDLFGEVF